MILRILPHLGNILQLRLLNPQKAIPLSFDLGNLTAFDPNPLSATFLTNESSLQSIARDTTQLLINELLSLPRTRSTEGVFIQLPPSTTLLPREKPVLSQTPTIKIFPFLILTPVCVVT